MVIDLDYKKNGQKNIWIFIMLDKRLKKLGSFYFFYVNMVHV